MIELWQNKSIFRNVVTIRIIKNKIREAKEKVQKAGVHASLES